MTPQTCGMAQYLCASLPPLLLRVLTHPEQQGGRGDSSPGCPDTDSKIRIPVLVLYLGGNSKKHWYGNGKTEGKMINGVLPSQ